MGIKKNLDVLLIIFCLISISCFLVAINMPCMNETHISGDMYMESTNFLPYLFLFLSIFFAIISIIYGVKFSQQKSKDKTNVKLKSKYHIITIGLISGFLLVVFGIILIYLGIGYMGGYGKELIYGLIMLPIGFIFLICFSMFIANNHYRIKRKNMILISTIFSIIAILFVFLLSVNLFSYKLVPPNSTPTIYCINGSSNETENMISWIVTDINSDQPISKNDLHFRLENSSTNYDQDSINITFHDNDNNNVVNIGDIFDVYAPEDGEYRLIIINELTDSISFVSREILW